MERNPAIDATLPKYKKQKREIWTAEMLMQALDACENKWLKVAFHLSFTATIRLGEVLGLTWDCVDISEEAIAENRAYIIVNKEVERVSKNFTLIDANLNIDQIRRLVGHEAEEMTYHNYCFNRLSDNQTIDLVTKALQ